MNLLPAWRDSLAIFQPKNFKLFFLVTLKTMVDTFKVWIKYFWWLMIIEATKPFWSSILWDNYLFNNPMLRLTVNLGMALITLLLTVSILLAARPSVGIKNCAYFRSYVWRIIYILPVSLLLGVGTEYLMNNVFYPYIGIPSSISSAIIAAVVLMGIVNWSAKIYLINYTLFLLDSDASIKQVLKSLLYGFKMVAYNYPFYIIVYVVYTSINLANHLLFDQLSQWHYTFIDGGESMSPSIGAYAIHYAALLIAALLGLFLYCFLINFYVKKLHDQFTLYFGKNE